MDDTGTDIAAWLESRRVVIESVPDDEIIGIGHALTHCRSLLGHLRHEAAGGPAGTSVRSVLFLGPAGTGKTLTARWLAGQLGPVPAYDLSAEQLTAERIRTAFAHLASAPRSVVFLAEVDSIAIDRRDADRESRAALFALLEALDGLAPVPHGQGPLVIATTNQDRRALDRALLRPGRLGTHVVFGLPKTAERVLLFQRFAGLVADGPVDWGRLASMSGGWSPADIRGAVDDALGLALLRDGGGARLTGADLVAAVQRGGVIEPDDARSFAELPQVALHEAGHVACAVALGVPVRSVHLGIGRRGGRTETGADDAVLADRDLVAGVVVTLGGVAAEQVLTDAPTAGAASDVLRATELVVMRIEAGLDPAFPPISRRAWGTTWAMSPLDGRIVPHAMATLEAARDQAREIVTREAAAILRFADRLLASGDLSGESLDLALAEAGWRSTRTAESEAA